MSSSPSENVQKTLEQAKGWRGEKENTLKLTDKCPAGEFLLCKHMHVCTLIFELVAKHRRGNPDLGTTL